MNFWLRGVERVKLVTSYDALPQECGTLHCCSCRIDFGFVKVISYSPILVVSQLIIGQIGPSVEAPNLIQLIYD